MTAIPISKNRHTEICTMKHEGQELTVEVVFEIVTEDSDVGLKPWRFPKPLGLTLTHKAADGHTQEMRLDGKAMAQLQILLGRITGMQSDDIAALPRGSVMPRHRL